MKTATAIKVSTVIGLLNTAGFVVAVALESPIAALAFAVGVVLSFAAYVDRVYRDKPRRRP